MRIIRRRMAPRRRIWLGVSLGLALALVAALVLLPNLPRPGAPRPAPWPTAAPPTYWPTAGWHEGTPEAHGMDAAKAADALAAIRQKAINIHSLLVIRDGDVVLDASFYPYDGTTPHDLASVTKSFTTTLIGIAADQGKLRLDAPVLSFFPDRTIANRDARKERITVANLASMTAGLDCVAEPDEPTLGAMMASPDWVQFTLDLPMVAEPGTTFAYCSPGMHLLSAILTKATGMSELDFARQYLFAPLGIRDAVWPADPQGYTHGWGDLHLFPRDAAKLGYLWLAHGVWDGTQIVSRAWVDDAVRVHAKPVGGDRDYGLGWWIQRTSDVGGEYDAAGRAGQQVSVLPALNALIVTTGGGFDPGEATALLAPALVDPTKPLPANPAGVARLNEAVASVRLAPAPRPVPPLPPTAAAISGTTYLLEPNPDIKTFRLVFDQSATARLFVTAPTGPDPPPAPVGLDGVYRMTPGEHGFAVGWRGYWEDATTFVLERDQIANLDAYVYRLRFAGETVVVDVSARTRATGARNRGIRWYLNSPRLFLN